MLSNSKIRLTIWVQHSAMQLRAGTNDARPVQPPLHSASPSNRRTDDPTSNADYVHQQKLRRGVWRHLLPPDIHKGGGVRSKPDRPARNITGAAKWPGTIRTSLSWNGNLSSRWSILP